MRLSYWKQWLWPNTWWVLRYLLPYNKLFHEAACFHDTMYQLKWDKQKADEWFYRLMMAKSKTKTQKTFAKIYFKLVSSFGNLYFKQ